jgi:hypothetical protein
LKDYVYLLIDEADGFIGRALIGLEQMKQPLSWPCRLDRHPRDKIILQVSIMYSNAGMPPMWTVNPGSWCIMETCDLDQVL